jgi:hypothetical protein
MYLDVYNSLEKGSKLLLGKEHLVVHSALKIKIIEFLSLTVETKLS